MSGSVVRSRGGLLLRLKRLRRPALGAAVIGCVLGLAACTSEEPVAQPTTTTEVVVTTTKATAEDLAFREAEAAYRAQVRLLDELSRSPGDKRLIKKLGETSTGVDKATWEIEYGTKWPARKWKMVKGRTQVRSVVAVKVQLGLNPPEMKLRACEDYSSVLVVDRNGKSVRDAGTPQMSINDVTVVLGQDSVWRVARTKNDLVKQC